MGVGAALVMPSTLSILTNTFPPHERGRAIGIWAGLAGAGAAIGPITSGWLLGHFWWGSVFLINIPIVVVAVVAGHFLVPTSRDENHERLDPVGALLSIVGLGVLLYGLIEAPNKGWASSQTLGAFAIAAVILGVFGWWELRNPHPMLDLAFFKNPRFSAACGAITFVFFAMFGLFFLFTQYLQLVKGYSPLGAGVRTLPMAFTMMIVAPSSARLVERTSPRTIVTIGLSTVAVGLLLMSRANVGTGYPYLAFVLVVLASGMGLTMAPSTGSIMSSIPMSKAGVGSAMNDTTRELGGALGVAVLGSLLASRYNSHVAPVVRALPANLRHAATESLGQAIAISHTLPGQAGVDLSLGARTAFAQGMTTALMVGASVALVAAGFVFRFLPAEQSFERPGAAPATPAAPAAVGDGAEGEAALNAAKAAALEP
jgi:EmrB/QacA subfamily drug resistance transporter